MQPTTWAALTIIGLLPGVTLAQELRPLVPEFRRTIQVTGEGSATAPPDMATIHTGVVTQAANAQEALSANSEAMEELLAALKDEQIAAKDIQTSQFNVHPIHKRDNQGRTLPEIVAYQVSNQVRVRVRQLSKLGVALDAVVKAGSNQVSGISFDVAEPTRVLDEARKQAIADARHRAETCARAADVVVGKLLSIREEPLRQVLPRYAANRAFEATSAVPVAPGEQEFRVTVELTFALEDGK